MAERKQSLEKTLRDSVGGPCDFPEKVDLPMNPDQMRVTKRVRGKMGEDTRFKKLIKKMIATGEITEEQAKEEWAEIR